jgi:hypothetical protein
MTQSVQYKRPSRINVVTLTLLVVVGLIVFLAMQYVPLFILKSEAYRVLEETGSHLASRKSRYTAVPEELAALRKRMGSELRNLGVDDPRAEFWIEIEPGSARLGVLYSKWIEWPFDVIAKQERVYELEHRVVLK